MERRGSEARLAPCALSAEGIAPTGLALPEGPIVPREEPPFPLSESPLLGPGSAEESEEEVPGKRLPEGFKLALSGEVLSGNPLRDGANVGSLREEKLPKREVSELAG